MRVFRSGHTGSIFAFFPMYIGPMIVRGLSLRFPPPPFFLPSCPDLSCVLGLRKGPVFLFFPVMNFGSASLFHLLSLLVFCAVRWVYACGELPAASHYLIFPFAPGALSSTQKLLQRSPSDLMSQYSPFRAPFPSELSPSPFLSMAGGPGVSQTFCLVLFCGCALSHLVLSPLF